ncbi:hypothetical protein LEL_10801 [Akanthomyces lecanii RCEF 1005]|uniref:Uncharacterized protein n=1 Tax=Akanthomyces lecanii RCEF 1005 TaxID=1081108 RepID=A0A167T2J1_CORDF|nr:hypothetical protein LEL_10801 [Akanthomyces lecanii RCEF 1005]
MAAGAPDATIDSLLSRPLSPGIRRKPVPPSLHHWDKKYTSLPLVTSENGSYHEKQPETHLAAHRSFGALLASWKLELLSVALSYASFITIAATLGSFQGKLATTWRMPISINAVVSIFSIIFKASLVLPITEGISQLKWLWLFQESRSLVDVDRYDQASRGPWGSARLIARQFVDRKRSYLASFGAAVFLLTLITDPFFQAAVQVNVCYRNATELASIPRLNNYDHNGGWVTHMTYKLDSDMVIAIMQGLLSTPQNSSVRIAPFVTCPTGNCTFPDIHDVSFSTLDMCHSCEDLSDLAKARPFHYTESEQVGSEWFLPGEISNLTTYRGGGALNITALRTNQRPSYPIGPWIRSSILDFQGLAELKDKSCTPKQRCPMIPFAFQCSLRPCVKTFKATMINQQYKETEVSREYLHRTSLHSFQLAMDRVFVNGSWVNCSSSTNLTEEHSFQVLLPEPKDVQMEPALPHPPLLANGSVWYPPHCVYSIEGSTSSALDDHLWLTFRNANVTPGRVVSASTIWAENLWSGGNMTMPIVNNFSDGLATAIGIQMRKVSDVNPWFGLQLGQAIERDSCITIWWRYLIFGAVVMVLETVFLAAVIISSHKRRWNANWKSSFLGLLLPPSDPEASPLGRGDVRADAVEDQSQLREAARGIKVSLTKRDGRWHLDTAEKPIS